MDFGILTSLLQNDIPMAMGWILAVWLFINNTRTHKEINKRVLDVVRENTESMQKLSDYIIIHGVKRDGDE